MSRNLPELQLYDSTVELLSILIFVGWTSPEIKALGLAVLNLPKDKFQKALMQAGVEEMGAPQC